MKFGKEYENIPLDTLEKMRMHIDILKIINDMEIDRERFNAEYQKTQIEVEKTRAEVEKMRKQINYYPWVALAIALIGAFAVYIK